MSPCSASRSTACSGSSVVKFITRPNAAALVVSGYCAVVFFAAGCCHCKPPAAATQPTTKPARKAPATTQAIEKPLYERLGGEKTIRAIVDDFVARVAADPKVNFPRDGHPNHWQ